MRKVRIRLDEHVPKWKKVFNKVQPCISEWGFSRPRHWTWQAKLLRNLSVEYISVDLGFYGPLMPGDTEDVCQATLGKAKVSRNIWKVPSWGIHEFKEWNGVYVSTHALIWLYLRHTSSSGSCQEERHKPGLSYLKKGWLSSHKVGPSNQCTTCNLRRNYLWSLHSDKNTKRLIGIYLEDNCAGIKKKKEKKTKFKLFQLY